MLHLRVPGKKSASAGAESLDINEKQAPQGRRTAESACFGSTAASTTWRIDQGTEKWRKVCGPEGVPRRSGEEEYADFAATRFWICRK
jgi:hypothetical protein